MGIYTLSPTTVSQGKENLLTPIYNEYATTLYPIQHEYIVLDYHVVLLILLGVPHYTLQIL